MTAIEWTDETWNPTTGCDRVSPGCDNCYALTLAKRLKGMGSTKYQTDGDPKTSGPGFGLAMHADALSIPLRWRKPRHVFVNSMSDLFHASVSDEFIARVFAVMALAPKHTFQVLTKRHARMRSLLSSAARDGFAGAVTDAGYDIVGPPWSFMRGIGEPDAPRWPLPNVWLGVSVEDQKRADLRIPALLDTPATVRFLSCEPFLGPIDLGAAALDWVIAGGESGHGARPMHVQWARSLRDQCTDARIPFFFKQWGGVNPKSGGRDLDGRTWSQMPEVAA